MTRRPASVLVAPTSPAGLVADVADSVDWACARGLDCARPTLVKVNGNFNLKYPGSNTSRWFIDALLAALRARGVADLQVVEGDLPEFRAVDMVRSTGLDDVLARHGVPFLALETLARDDRELPRIFADAQLINVPVPHTHAQAVISCATKNLFGILPWDRRKYHGVLEDKCLELAAWLPCFTFVDATVGLDGESTRRGNPVKCDLIFAGADPLAIDWVVAGTMGFVPGDIPLLRRAAERGLVGSGSVVVEGPFSGSALPRHHFALELSPVRRLTNALYRTPLVRFAPLWAAGDVLRTRWHKLNHWRKRRRLEDGPWMEYERSLESRLHDSRLHDSPR